MMRALPAAGIALLLAGTALATLPGEAGAQLVGRTAHAATSGVIADPDAVFDVDGLLAELRAAPRLREGAVTVSVVYPASGRPAVVSLHHPGTGDALPRRHPLRARLRPHLRALPAGRGPAQATFVLTTGESAAVHVDVRQRPGGEARPGVGGVIVLRSEFANRTPLLTALQLPVASEAQASSPQIVRSSGSRRHDEQARAVAAQLARHGSPVQGGSLLVVFEAHPRWTLAYGPRQGHTRDGLGDLMNRIRNDLNYSRGCGSSSSSGCR